MKESKYDEKRMRRRRLCSLSSMLTMTKLKLKRKQTRKARYKTENKRREG